MRIRIRKSQMKKRHEKVQWTAYLSLVLQRYFLAIIRCFLTFEVLKCKDSESNSVSGFLFLFFIFLEEKTVKGRLEFSSFTISVCENVLETRGGKSVKCKFFEWEMVFYSSLTSTSLPNPQNNLQIIIIHVHICHGT